MNFRRVVTAALLTIGLYAAGFIIPLLGQVLALFTPVPIILVYYRQGRRAGFAALAGAVVLAGVLGGWQIAAILLLSFGLMAIGTTEGLRRGLKPERIALLGGLLPVLAGTLIVGWYFLHTRTNPLTAVESYFRNSMAEAAKVYTDMGLPEVAAMVSAVSDTFVRSLIRLLPSIIITTSVMQAAFCYGLARVILGRRGELTAESLRVPFSSWHAPDAWVWGLIAALAMIAMPQEAAKFIGWNLAILLAVVYLAQGTAIADHYLKKGRMNMVVRGLIIILVLALPSMVFVIALGVVDVWADVRNVRGPAKTA